MREPPLETSHLLAQAHPMRYHRANGPDECSRFSASKPIRRKSRKAVSWPSAARLRTRTRPEISSRGIPDPTATHNCWAFRIGQTYRFNDDGEPSGTAGKPILQAIDGQSLDHVAALVVRWFGGTLLGSGGLIRAYGGTAAMCLRAAEKTQMIETTGGTVVCEFADLALIKARLAGMGVTIASETFTGTGAELTLQIPRGSCQAASAIILDLSRGRAALELED